MYSMASLDLEATNPKHSHNVYVWLDHYVPSIFSHKPDVTGGKKTHWGKIARGASEPNTVWILVVLMIRDICLAVIAQLDGGKG